MKNSALFFMLIIIIAGCNTNDRSGGSAVKDPALTLYTYTEDMESRWVSFENISGTKGRGGMENNGAKGHACDSIAAGARKVMLDIKGPGIINRMWFTISDRSPQMLRNLIINIYWDNEEKPAVSVPFGDFFGIGLGKTTVFENALFANPEGRSFNCFVQMPFKEAARIELVNESETELPMVFYDVNLQLLKKWDNNYLYFHSYWHRDTLTALAGDFEIMPAVSGKGRFLGSNVSIHANPAYKECWWGEGEVKIYLDGDSDFPTLVGSGTEDYIGTAWGQGQYVNHFTGCPVADDKNRQWAFYRFHIPDPVYFKSGCRVTLQQIGGNTKEIVTALQNEGVDLIPVTVHDVPRMIHIYHKDSIVNLATKDLPEGWTNFYRSDDLAAASYFYLNQPSNDLPAIQPAAIRTWKIK